jgi:hypothetical protein
MTLIADLGDGKFSLVDVPEQRQVDAPTAPTLTEQELREELIRRGIQGDKLEDIIAQAKEESIAIW